MKTTVKFIPALLLMLTISSCNDNGMGTLTCFNTNEYEIMRRPGSSCDLSILWVDLEGSFDLSGYDPDDEVSFTTLNSGVLGLQNFFSDAELQKIRDEKLVSKTASFRETFLYRLPAFSPDSGTGRLVQQEVFEITQDYIAITDPGNGKKYYIYDFDYVKLRGWPCIPLPKPEHD